MKFFFKKTLIAVALVAATCALSLPSRVAHAQFGAVATVEVGPEAAGVAATAAFTGTQTLIVQSLNAVAWTVAKMAVQSITRSTVNWINSGFNGSPAFVSDLNSNLHYLGDAVAENFFTQLNQTAVQTTGFNLTSPFQDQINQQLREEYYRTTGSWGLNYTLNQTSADPKAFINGDFSKGGFDAFLSANSNPANNPFGAYQLASNQLWAQVDASQQQRKAELDWGKGFLPWRGDCTTTTSTVSLSQSEKCPFNAVRTPGSVIESQLENTLGSGVRELDLADSINEIVGALMGQLVNQVLGPGGLIGTSQPSSGGGNSYITQATSPSTYDSQTASLASGVVQNIQNDITKFTTYRTQWQKVLDEANAAQQRCGTSVDVTTAITLSSAGVAKGDAAITKENTALTSVQSAVSSTAVDKSTQITSALAGYQSLLSSPDLPTPTDISQAALESTDTGTTTTPSLYTQMQNKANGSCLAT